MEFKILRDEYFESFKSDYTFKVDIARDDKKINAHNIFYNDLIRPKIGQIQNKLGELSRFFYEVEEIVGLDKRKEISEVFNEKFNLLKVENKGEVLTLLSELEGLNEMFDFWRREEATFHRSEEHDDEIYILSLRDMAIIDAERRKKLIRAGLIEPVGGITAGGDIKAGRGIKASGNIEVGGSIEVGSRIEPVEGILPTFQLITQQKNKLIDPTFKKKSKWVPRLKAIWVFINANIVAALLAGLSATIIGGLILIKLTHYFKL